jgi:4-hydroxy-tetrahydrodipicolinate reductase
MRLAVVGASGKMGCAVVRLASAEGIAVACAVGISDVGKDAGVLAGIGPIGVPIMDDIARIGEAQADVVVDFSSPSATAKLAPIAAAAGSALVSGTTGLGDDGRAALSMAAERIPVLWEPNMSVGVHLLSELVARAAAALPHWDVEIVETHHRAKVDAPSGTALRLAEVAQNARPAAMRVVYGRQGKEGERGSNEIGIHAVRGGDIVGDHVVHLLGASERLELSHSATNRDVFAHGALRAARWIARRPPGRYGLQDVLAAKT